MDSHLAVVGNPLTSQDFRHLVLLGLAHDYACEAELAQVLNTELDAGL